MLSHTDLKKGVMIIVDGQPYEVVEAVPQRYAQRKLMIQTKLKNLLSGSVIQKNVHQGEAFQEAGVEKMKTKFLYSHRDKFFFSEEQNPAKRFDLSAEQIGNNAKFLKDNTTVDALVFNEKIVNIVLPVKVQLKVTEAPPGIRGDRAQAGTKAVTVETGAQINVPLFIEAGDVIEVNTETGEYAKRVE